MTLNASSCDFVMFSATAAIIKIERIERRVLSEGSVKIVGAGSVLSSSCGLKIGVRFIVLLSFPIFLFNIFLLGVMR
jgi:hypothetical protein